MRAFLRLVVLLPVALSVFIPRPAFGAIPLPSAPSWTSNDNDYSTGGALADVNGDGWLDFLVSNGNDMAIDKNSAYMNSAGTLEAVASWRSSDSGLFGHCYAGDVNNDGLPDLAVAYLGSGGGGECLARIYLNSGGTLGASPAWKAADRHSSFDCCLGDVDLDGDLDLAISAGDAYVPTYDGARIYRSIGGTFDTLPFWSARDTNPGDAVRFCDIDNDGDLDLFVGQRVPGSGHGKVTMYRNNGGVLDTLPSWTAQQGVGWVLRLAFADYDNDGWPDLAAACNNQLSDPNGVRVYHNSGGTLDTLPSFSMLESDDEASCVAWADVNDDGYLDLAAGRWFGAVQVFENHAGVLDTTPSWSWNAAPSGSLVCEAVVWGDLTNGHLAEVTEAYDGDGQRKLFNLHRRPLQSIDSVHVDGTRVPVAGFCSDLLGGWVSFASAPPSGSGNVVFFYRYSTAPDLALTNWDQSHGNYVFANTTPAAVREAELPNALARVKVWPNPAAGLMKIALADPAPGRNGTIAIYDRTGRARRILNGSDGSWTWDGRDDAGRIVAPGVYFAALGSLEPSLKLVRVAQD